MAYAVARAHRGAERLQQRRRRPWTSRSQMRGASPARGLCRANRRHCGEGVAAPWSEKTAVAVGFLAQSLALVRVSLSRRRNAPAKRRHANWACTVSSHRAFSASGVSRCLSLPCVVAHSEHLSGGSLCSLGDLSAALHRAEGMERCLLSPLGVQREATARFKSRFAPWLSRYGGSAGCRPAAFKCRSAPMAPIGRWLASRCERCRVPRTLTFAFSRNIAPPTNRGAPLGRSGAKPVCELHSSCRQRISACPRSLGIEAAASVLGHPIYGTPFRANTRRERTLPCRAASWATDVATSTSAPLPGERKP